MQVMDLMRLAREALDARISGLAAPSVGFSKGVLMNVLHFVPGWGLRLRIDGASGLDPKISPNSC